MSAKEVRSMHELNRKEKLLKLIVEQFIKTAEPVGSSALIEEYDLPYSSATVRNEMAELERLGYLEKTHTSSGRVPSSEGYRYYVDYLRDAQVDTTMRYQIQNLFERGQLFISIASIISSSLSDAVSYLAS
jgi:heat-inducible transcriptional repressor